MSKLEQRLSIHHVGARYGNSSFPEIKNLEKGLVKVLYDADEGCLDEVETYNHESDSELHVLPYCFSNKCDVDVPFYINLDPFSSSLYELNEQYKERYVFVSGSDYPLKEGFSVKEQISINTTTIDEQFFNNRSSSFPPPDFLSLDVQGAEYDILDGARNVLQENVLAVCLEVEFVPLYKNQACFGQISELMESMGFVFARFLDIHEFSPYRGPIGARGNGFHSYGNALFLRKTSSIKKKSDPALQDLMFKKLAFISILFDQMEFGLQCLGECIGEGLLDGNSDDVSPQYLNFIEAFDKIIRDADNVYPISFKNVVNNENCKDYPNKTFFVYAVQLEKVIDFLCQKLDAIGRNYSPIEVKMREYGMISQAELIWKNRIKQSLYDDGLASIILKDSGENEAFFCNVIAFLKGKTISYSGHAIKYLETAMRHFDEVSNGKVEQSKQNFFYSLGSFLKSIKQDDMSKIVFDKLLIIKVQANAPLHQLSYVYYHLGELDMRSEYWGCAREYFQKCIDIMPEHRKARTYIQQIDNMKDG